MNAIAHYHTLEAYCRAINIAPPKWSGFDIRSFGENMKSVKHKMPPFKHEFYAIALKLDGSGYAKTGNYSTEKLKATVFFNSPYQILQWDIAPDWNGYYIIFSEEFYRNPPNKNRITERFPYLLSDKTLPLSITTEETQVLEKLFQDMLFEFVAEQKQSQEIIRFYINILLLKVGRLFESQSKGLTIDREQRNNDIKTVSRFKTIMELAFQPDKTYGTSHPHQVRFYADKVNLHPNHFNAVIKRITDKSASEHIYGHILSLAKSKLLNSTTSVKEIAYELYYSYPNHFGNFFKTRTGMTPSEFRKAHS
ncbi:helix-turn-helix domain-containing protein [Allomuricauda sp. SCSIO 65647]|uniref:helix-turn-helix domain-containing protein n=1 Tax=Allomuricauda sp. SCSIO 65647 TaxID=2908843 RepID=UPI001F2BB9D1|nr:helix-turn-helix domain-containing protein [Muricauda sp. SCSIO 65647]UJH68833.1 helix-turn-helix domain-containing protein [Muricauda sp. SCSIO 65647]